MCRRKKSFDQFERKREIAERLTFLTMNWSPSFAPESPESAVHAEELRTILSDACAVLKKIVLPRRDEQKIALCAESILSEIDALERMKTTAAPSARVDSAETEEGTDDAVRKIANAILMWSRER